MKYTNPETKQSIGRRYSFKDLERATQRRSNNKDSKMKIIGLPKRYLFSTRRFRIYEVDGEWIRNNIYSWFGTGGHGRVHCFIPNREIWIEKNHGTIKYMARTVLHEIVEFDKMRKIPFYQAHLAALKAEFKYPSSLKWLIKKLQRTL